MASSMIRGLILSGTSPTDLWATDTLEGQLTELARVGVRTARDNLEAVLDSDCIVLGVKPDVLPKVVAELAPALRADTLIISIAAGVTTQTISKALGRPGCIVRFMPNIAAEVLMAATGMYASPQVSVEQKARSEHLANAFGNAVWLTDEGLMDAVTAVSGSGPAYFFLMMEMMVREAQSLGLTRGTATRLVVQTALGSAKLAQQSDADLAELRERVTSPNGTTAAAIECFLANDFPGTVGKAVQAANNRGRELAAG